MAFARPDAPQFYMNSFTAPSPESTDSLCLEGGPDPTAFAMQNSPDLCSITGSSAEDHQDPLFGYGLSSHASGVPIENSTAINYSLLQFCNDRNLPWNSWDSLSKSSGVPKSAHIGNGDPSPFFGNQLPAQPFIGQRGVGNRSVCDTIGDSGYGSLPRKSVGIPSVYDDVDHSGETQSIIHPFSDLHRQSFVSETPSASAATSRNDAPKTASKKQHSSSHLEVSPSSYACHHCQKNVKTQSELKKHLARHTKPFRCDEPGCTRTEGFSTFNDLQRHKESVHNAGGVKYRCSIGPCAKKDKIWPRADNFRQHLKRVHKIVIRSPDALEEYLEPSAGIKSAACDVDTRDNDPWGHQDPLGVFPTEEEDGFGDHQFRGSPSLNDPFPVPTEGFPRSDKYVMESLDPGSLGLDEMLAPIGAPGITMNGPLKQGDELSFTNAFNEVHAQHAEAMVMEVDGKTEARITSHPDDKRIAGATISFQDQPPVSVEQIAPHSTANAAHDGSETDSVGSDGDFDTMIIMTPATTVSDWGVKGIPAINPLASASVHIAAPQTRDAIDANDILDDVKLGDEDHSEDHFKLLNALIAKSLVGGQLDGILKQLGYQKSLEKTTKSRKPLPASGSQKEDNPVACPECPKTFGRQCELKKHLKRHEKPYGCTFSNCTKHFGSKNDWKRHENGQHFHMEMWKCEEASKNHPGKTCPKVCNRREKFREHLQRDHGIKSFDEVERKCGECRLGRNGEARFWCGFCEKTIDIKQKGCGAWAERFDHIDNHYTGRGGFKKMERSEWKGIDPVLPDLGFPGVNENSSSSYRIRDMSPPASPHETMEPVTMLPSLNPAKRARDDDDDDECVRQKRQRMDGRMAQFWICCHCESEWLSETTNSCKNERCKVHIPCFECTYTEKFISNDREAVMLGDD